MSRCTKSTHAWRVHDADGKYVIAWEKVDLPDPGKGEVRIRHTAVAVNQSDIRSIKTGAFLQRNLELPAVVGMEGVGRVQALGEGVTNVQAGDRVAYVGMGGRFSLPGSYCVERNFPADRLVVIPAGLTEIDVAAVFSKGLTVAGLVQKAFQIKPEDTVLLHGAAGATGLILSQWARHLGASVIGTVSNTQKAELALAHGCTHTILYKNSDFVSDVRALAPQGVSVVYDGVGKATFMRSLECLQVFGVLVSYGGVSGPAPMLDPRILLEKGSLSVICPGLRHFVATADLLLSASAQLFTLMAEGAIAPHMGARYALEDAPRALSDVENGTVSGSAVMLV